MDLCQQLCLCLFHLQGKTRDAFRSTLIYPYRFGSEQTVLVFAEVAMIHTNQLCIVSFKHFPLSMQDSFAESAKSAGADIVGGEELIAKVMRSHDSHVTTLLMNR